jgi:hypothetical protein
MNLLDVVHAAHVTSVLLITIRDFSEKFSEAGHIGSGSFGSVNVAVDKQSGQQYAVKVIKKKFSGSVVEPLLARQY